MEGTTTRRCCALTFARIAMLAGGRVRDHADDGVDCGGGSQIAGACTSSSWATSQLSHHHHHRRWRGVLSRRAQLTCPSRSHRETPSRAARSRGQSSCCSAGGRGRRRHERSERECMAVHVAHGVLCAFLALCIPLWRSSCCWGWIFHLQHALSTPPARTRAGGLFGALRVSVLQA